MKMRSQGAGQETQAVLKTLKQIVRSKKLRYRDLAESLNVSEQTIKRLFSSDRDISLLRLSQLCDVLGLSLADLTEMAKQGALQEFRLTEAQEQLLADQPELFALYELLRDGHTPAQIAQRHGLKDPVLFRALRKLEKAGLLEIGRKNTVRLVHKGQCSWIIKGPLQRRFLLQNDTRFVEGQLRGIIQHGPRAGAYVNSAWYRVSKETRARLIADLSAAVQGIHRQAARDQSTLPDSELESVKWVVCLGDDPFSYDELVKRL